jgi:hypothetical protein
VNLEGEKGHESIGSSNRLTAEVRVRTLGRSKALKSQALACPTLLQTAFREPYAPRCAHRTLPPVSGSGRSLELEPTSVGTMNELMPKLPDRVVW